MPAQVTPSTEAQLIEVFSSIQGEGLLVGCRQIFLRFARCNLDCAYCDTPFAPQPECRIEDAPGSGNFSSLPNPVGLELLYNVLFQWQKGAAGMHHSIALTGGEPLLHSDVLEEWLPALRRLLPIHLETNGTLPEALPALLTYLDWIAMDIKLESVTGQPTFWEAHKAFLAQLRGGRDQIKLVVGEETPLEEVSRAASLVHELAPETPLVLQPVTRHGQMTLGPRQLLDLQATVASRHPAVRVIPQTHRFIGLL
ncbi:MAG TPA: 7-carboxy-7-deazaguanine synthase QueE [Desulfuromonadales bacterium]|nr:7-carboxy-7-deazaguanine synthase QueE [Desulfuromonadales bacterium]